MASRLAEHGGEVFAVVEDEFADGPVEHVAADADDHAAEERAVEAEPDQHVGVDVAAAPRDELFFQPA